MIKNQSKVEVSMDELRNRKPKLDSSDFPTSDSSSISLTVLLEGDLIRLLRDYYKFNEFDNYDLWVDAIQKDIAKSLQFCLLELIVKDHVTATTVIKFDRS